MMRFIFFIFLLLFQTNLFAANVKITEMTEDTAPTTDDLTVTVNAPSGSAANRKVTLANLTKGLNVSNVTTGTLPVANGGTGATALTDLITLGTHTTGGYAASVSEAGPATTATALAANGGNCSAGEYPLGVDASGAVESCTDATTEIAAYAQPLDSDLTTYAGITPSANIQTFLGSADYSAARTNLGVAIGTNVQAYDADLTTWAGVTPSANGQSLVSAANYAAMRTLLDLEAGTDFYSISAADAAFQPLEATLTDIADGTIAENLVNTANPWADNEVADTITASNYLPLAGGTMTGELKLAAQGLEGTATDTLTDCSTFSATGGGIFYDASEGKWKKCQDNVLSDLDTGGGGGDSVSIDSVAVTDPDFVSTGDIDFVDTSNTVTANITNDKVTEAKLKAVDTASDEDVLTYETTTGDFEWHSRDEIVGGISAGALPNDSVLEADLKAVDAAADEDIFTYESTTGDFEWHTMDQMIANMSAGGLPNDSILEADLKAVDTAADEECLTYETTTGDFEWQACGSGSDTNAQKVFVWPASATLPLEAADSIPPIGKDAGTNIDMLYVAFDSAADECRSVSFRVPPDVASGTVTFKVDWYSAAATTGAAAWDFRHNSGVTTGTDPDQSLTLEFIESDTTAGTAGQLNVASGTETIANLGWSADELVYGVFCRDGNGTNGTDDLTGDALAIEFTIEIPRA